MVQPDQQAQNAFNSLNTDGSDAVNLQNLYNKGGDFDYEQVKNVAGRIGSGELEISRLTREEEAGRLEGGRRNVEASVIAGAETRANPATSQRGADGKKAKIESNRRVELNLEKYARSEGIWFNTDIFRFYN